MLMMHLERAVYALDEDSSVLTAITANPMLKLLKYRIHQFPFDATGTNQ